MHYLNDDIFYTISLSNHGDGSNVYNHYGLFCKIKQNNTGKKIIKSEKLISLRWVFIYFTRSATSKYLYANDNRV